MEIKNNFIFNLKSLNQNCNPQPLIEKPNKLLLEEEVISEVISHLDDNIKIDTLSEKEEEEDDFSEILKKVQACELVLSNA